MPFGRINKMTLSFYLCPMQRRIRTRFAPSPTGGLHIGGVRTALFNYLFAKPHGDFILRIEDTDQGRYVEGAEKYIIECLKWCGIHPDESTVKGGPYGPYRQSERKEIYKQYAQKLIDSGNAYYAFDTPEELAVMREKFRTETNPNPQYGLQTRMQMKNSLTMSDAEVKDWLESGKPYVIRFKMPEGREVKWNDLIRGEVSFNTDVLDDKVLLKADGMPTYHLAVVTDDLLMEITHVLRGEEWLSSTPLHLLLWEAFGVNPEIIPQYGHLPLILGPQGKLSKRDGAKYGFPVYGMNWTEPDTGNVIEGFKEKGFLPEAFVNMLAMIGWNDGTGQEIFTMEELVEKFTIERVHSGGAKFDYEKAKWFNHMWMQKVDERRLTEYLFEDYSQRVEKGTPLPENQTYLIISENLAAYCEKVVKLIKNRCNLLTDLWEEGKIFFVQPSGYDTAAVKPKWTTEKEKFFKEYIRALEKLEGVDAAKLEEEFKALAAAHSIKPGELQLPMRIMLVGGKFGPPVFEIAATLGIKETIKRIEQALPEFAI
jgi:glutamyl-tRNA synthetase